MKEKDIEKPDTVAAILGFEEHQDGQKTKVNQKALRKQLRQQEIEAWVETTKNIALENAREHHETSALKKLLQSQA